MNDKSETVDEVLARCAVSETVDEVLARCEAGNHRYVEAVLGTGWLCAECDTPQVEAFPLLPAGDGPIRCDVVLPGSNFERLDRCENKARLAVTYANGKTQHYCFACSDHAISLCTWFGAKVESTEYLYPA